MSSLNEKLKQHIRDRCVDASQIAENQRSQRVSLEIPIERKCFNTKEAAAYLSVKPATVANLKCKGLLKSLSSTGAGRRMITKESLDKYLGVKK